MSIHFVAPFGFLTLVAGVMLSIFLLIKLLPFVFRLVGRSFHMVVAMFGELVHMIGSLVTAAVLVPLLPLNALTGNSSRCKHYGRALGAELKGAFLALYRLSIRHPLAFFGLGSVVDRAVNEVPEIVRQAPGPDVRRGEEGMFAGYRILGSLPGGGSGASLWIAEPGSAKRVELARSGFPEVGRVVIKAFSLAEGPILPQIVRESRALEAAKRLHLVLEHGLDEQRFWYIMPYVPGENLSVVIHRMHAAAGGNGLPVPQLRRGISYVSDLLLALERYHQGGLWHKDVKPDNIVICGDRAYLVDLGLVTPLHSAMTLTTHGTEYYRDPELVRMAMKGAKVNEVDGVRFDLYGVGAVLYSLVEGSFPAHGSLSRISKHCPEALRWIVNRAMAEMHGRYRDAREMLLDLHVVLAAEDPFAVKPASLPSLGGPVPEYGEVPPASVPPPVPPAPSGRRSHGGDRWAEGPSPTAPRVLRRERRAERRRARRSQRNVIAAVAAFLIAIPVSLALALLIPPHSASRTSLLRAVPALPMQTVGSQRIPLTVSAVSLTVSRTASSAADVAFPRLLIVDDYSGAGNAGSEERSAALRERLDRAGYRLVGDGCEATSGEELEFLAQARNAIGLEEPMDALQELGRALDLPDDFAGVLWLRRSDRPTSAPLCYLLAFGKEQEQRLRDLLRS